MDGDGLADLAVANETSNNVSILLGNGAGGFVAGGTGAPWARGRSPSSSHELTGDDFLDLAVACATTNTVSVAAGNGDGTFDRPSRWKRAGSRARWPSATSTATAGPTWRWPTETTNDAWIVLNRSGAITDLAVSAGNGVSHGPDRRAGVLRVAVTNLGPSAAASVTLDLDVPEALEDVVYTPSAGTFDVSDRRLDRPGPRPRATRPRSPCPPSWPPPPPGRSTFEAAVTARRA